MGMADGMSRPWSLHERCPLSCCLAGEAVHQLADHSGARLSGAHLVGELAAESDCSAVKKIPVVGKLTTYIRRNYEQLTDDVHRAFTLRCQTLVEPSVR